MPLIMKRELADYKVTPKVVLANIPTTITIAPRGYHAKFDDTKEYTIKFITMEHSIEPTPQEGYEGVTLTPKNGILSFTHSFPDEQMHTLRVMLEDTFVIDFTIFSLFEDLYSKRPYKGDLHTHSCQSDGHEEPAVVVANYRKAGFDFMAVTDHHKWQPSKEAIDAYADIPTDMGLFYGEEVHVFHFYIHAINFGGSFSVNDYYYANKEKCDAEVAEFAVKHPTPKGIDPLDYARRYWIAQKIRESGGLAIFVHPHWQETAFHVPDIMSDYLFEQGTYDAFELLGGQSIFENNMQTAFYQEQRAKGRVIPIVGSSDSHGTEPPVYFKKTYTLLFAEELTLDSIKKAIMELYSVAVECYDDSEKRVYGAYRMAKYAMFLEREYFPMYEELCFEQGRSMKDAVLGDQTARTVLDAVQGRTDQFADEFFGR